MPFTTFRPRRRDIRLRNRRASATGRSCRTQIPRGRNGAAFSASTIARRGTTTMNNDPARRPEPAGKTAEDPSFPSADRPLPCNKQTASGSLGTPLVVFFSVITTCLENNQQSVCRDPVVIGFHYSTARSGQRARTRKSRTSPHAGFLGRFLLVVPPHIISGDDHQAPDPFTCLSAEDRCPSRCFSAGHCERFSSAAVGFRGRLLCRAGR